MAGAVVVGAVAVDIVPSAGSFLEKLAAQILPQTAALADKVGDQFGEPIQKKTAKAVRDGLGGSGGEAAEAGEQTAQKWAGAFARRAKASMREVEAALPTIDVEADIDVKTQKFLAKVKEARDEATSLSKLEMGVGLDSKDFLKLVTDLKARIAAIQKDARIDVKTRVDTAQSLATLATFEASVAAANVTTGTFAATLGTTLKGALNSLPTPKIDMKLTGDKEARATLKALRRELADLSGQRIGIDLDAGKAIARVQALHAALTDLSGSTTDQRLKLDTAAALAKLTAFLTAVGAAKEEVERPVEIKLRTGSFLTDARAALAQAAALKEIPAGATATPGQLKASKLGDTAASLAVKDLTPRFGEDQLIARMEKVRAELGKLGDAAKFGDAVAYEADKAEKSLGGFLDSLNPLLHGVGPKVDFRETEVGAGVAAKRVQKAFADVLADLPDPIITAHDNAPEVQQHYEKLFRTVQDVAGAKIGLDLPTPEAVKTLDGVEKELARLREHGHVSVDIDVAAPKARQVIAGLGRDLAELRGHTVVEVDADTKPAVKQFGYLETRIKAVVAEMTKALGDGFSGDLLGAVDASVKRDVDDMVRELGIFNKQKLGDVGAESLLIKLEDLVKGFRDVSQAANIGEAARANILRMLQPVDALHAELLKLKGLDVTPQMKADKLRTDAGKLVQDLAARFKAIGDIAPEIRPDVDKSEVTRLLDTIAAQFRDLHLRVGVDLPVSESIAKALALHEALKKILGSKIDLDVGVKGELNAMLAETGGLLKSLGIDAASTSQGLAGMVEKFTSMTPAAMLANAQVVLFAVGLPLLLAAVNVGLFGMAGLLIVVGAAAGTAVLGVGVLALALHNVVKAIGEKEQAAKQAAANALADQQTELSNAIALKNATDAITAAQKALGAARVDAARDARDAALAVTAAQLNVTQATTKEAAARKRLNDATRSARINLRELTLAIKDNQIAQRAALVTITQAREKYNALLADPTASESDIEAAQANYNTQQDSLQKLRLEQDKNRLAKAKYDRDGLAGDSEVLAAQTELANAIATVHDATLAVTAAQTRQRDQAIDDAKKIDAAEIALAKARTDRANTLRQQQLAAAQTKATRAQQTTTYDTLTPEGKQFVDFYEAHIRPIFKELFDTAQKSGALKSIEDFFTQLKPLMPDIDSLITTVGKSIGDFLGRLGTWMAGPDGKDFLAFLKKEAPAAFKLLGDAVLKAGPFVLDLIKSLAPVAKQLGPQLVSALGKMADSFARFTKTKEFKDLLKQMVIDAPLLLGVLGDLAKATLTLLEAFAPLSNFLLVLIDLFLKLIHWLGPQGIIWTIVGVGAALALLVTGPIGAIIAGVGALIAVIYYFTKYWSTWSDWLIGAGKAIGHYFEHDFLHDFGAFLYLIFVKPFVDTWHGIEDVWTKLKKVFSGGVEAVKGIWGGLKAILADPLHAVIGLVNKWVISPFNTVAHWVGSKGIDPIPDQAPATHMAHGGVLPGYAPGVDSIPVLASPGEGWLVPQAVLALGRDRIEEWNLRARHGQPLQRFATGGVVEAQAPQALHAKPTGLAGKAVGFIEGELVAPLRQFVEDHGDNGLVRVLVGGPTKLLEGITTWLVKQAAAVVEAVGDAVGSAGRHVLDFLHLGGDEAADTSGVMAAPAAAAAYAKARLPKLGWDGAQLTPLETLWNGESGWRWNAKNPDSGAYGIAQALPASKMADAGADWAINAHTQVDWGMAYIKATYGDPAHALAAWLGRSPHWYDQGGYLPPGLSLAMNATGKPEPILTAEQWQAMREQRGQQQVGVTVRVQDGAVTGLVSAEVDRQFGQLADASVYGGV